MRICKKSLTLAAIAMAAGLAVSGCGGGNSGAGSSTPPANGVVTVYPGTASVSANPSTQVQFSAFLPSQPGATFTWSVSGGSGNGTINATTGLYTPPSSVPSPATVTITAAYTAATNEIGTATITITAGQTFVMSPAALSVPAGGTQAFMVTTNTTQPIPALTWNVNGIAGGNATVGTITNAGVYTAPLTPPPEGFVSITATGSGVTVTATATIVFSNNSLNGSYAFSYSGGDASGYPVAVAGSFTTTPSTGAISGIEDYNADGSATVAPAVPVSGNYQVNPDGSGSATLSNGATIVGTETLQFTLGAGTAGGASKHALLVRFDNTATGSGSIDLQNVAELNNLNLSSISGNYVLNLSGLDANGYPLQFAGIFNADGAGTIPVNYAEEDINDGGISTVNAPDLSLHGTYSIDSGNSGSGRGLITLTNTSSVYPCNCQFAFYMVDSTHLKVVEIVPNSLELLSGDVYAAPNTARGSYALGSLNGNYALTLGGADLSRNAGLVQGGVFSANGSGGITGGVWDTNDGGSTQLNQSVASSTYSVDTSLGRIALPIAYGSTTINYAAYAGSNGLLEMVSLDPSYMDSGTAYLQTSTAAPLGAFALNLTGILNSSNGGEEDVAGQMTVPASGAPTGNLFINSSGSLATGTPLGAASSVSAPDSNGRGTASVASHLATFPVVYYTVDGNTVLLLESDGSRTMAGVLSRQF